MTSEMDLQESSVGGHAAAAGRSNVMPHYLSGEQFSAYGTRHPLDVALGVSRRRNALKAMAHGGARSPSQIMHEARAISMGG